MDIEAKKQHLLDIGWKLCMYEPTPSNNPLFWDLSEHERRRRYYVCPVHAPNGYRATLRETEAEALDDMPGTLEAKRGAE